MLIFSFISSILFMIVFGSFIVMLILTAIKQKKLKKQFDKQLDETIKNLSSFDLRS